MIDLTRTLFRLSFHEDSDLETLSSATSRFNDGVLCSANSITSNVYINHIVPKETDAPETTGSQIFQPVKFHKLEDLDVESIRDKQAEFLKSLHHLHMTE